MLCTVYYNLFSSAFILRVIWNNVHIFWTYSRPSPLNWKYGDDKVYLTLSIATTGLFVDKCQQQEVMWFQSHSGCHSDHFSTHACTNIISNNSYSCLFSIHQECLTPPFVENAPDCFSLLHHQKHKQMWGTVK